MSTTAAPLLLPLLCLAAASCRRSPGDAPEPAPGERVLSLSISPRLEPPPTVQDFVDAFNAARAAGVRGSFISKTWRTLEPTAGSFALTDLRRDVAGTPSDAVLLLGIQVLNTTAKEAPADLAGDAFDAPRMRERFRALLDSLGPALLSRAAYISIGNEVDVYLAAHPAEWAAYRGFLGDAAAYVRSVAPGARVGVTATFDGATGAPAAEVARLNEVSDVAIYTYYPLGASFRPRPASGATADIAALVSAARGKRVVLQEVGYPSATLLGSSERAQADFIAAVFGAWRAQGGGRIPFLNVFLMHDLTAPMCDQFGVYYGLPNSAEFKAFLCSLGLRYANGTPKAAWQTFADSGRVVR